MECPSCRKSALKPVKLDDRLPAYTCLSCNGYLIDILSYRMWKDSRPELQNRQKNNLSDVEDSKNAILCPKCSKIMEKYQLSGEVENKLDLCPYCGEIWLDGGEWELLEELNLSDKIPQILSQPWQKAIRLEKIELSIEEKFENIFGTDDYQKIKKFRDWMQSLDKINEIINYISRPVDKH